MTPRTGPSGTNTCRRMSPRGVAMVRSAGVSLVPAALFAVRARSACRPSGVCGSGCGNPARAAFACRCASRTAGSIPVTSGLVGWNWGHDGPSFRWASLQLTSPPRRRGGLQELVDGDGEVEDAPAGGVVDGVADGRGGAGDADLTGAKYAEWRGRVGVVQAVDVDGRNVGVHGHVVFGQAGVDDAAAARVDEGGFGEREADAPDDAAAELAACGFEVDDGTDVEHAHPAGDAYFHGVRVDAHLAELGARGGFHPAALVSDEPAGVAELADGAADRCVGADPYLDRRPAGPVEDVLVTGTAAGGAAEAEAAVCGLDLLVAGAPQGRGRVAAGPGVQRALEPVAGGHQALGDRSCLPGAAGAGAGRQVGVAVLDGDRAGGD